MPKYLPLLIPLIAVCIPLIAVTGRFVIEPLVRALGWQADGRDRRLDAEAQARIALLEARLESMERTLARVVEEQDFQRALQAPRPVPDTGAAPGPLPLPHA